MQSNKHILGIIYKIKQCFSEIDSCTDDENIMQNVNDGLTLSDNLHDILSSAKYLKEVNETTANPTEPCMSWHYLKDNDIPALHSDILMATISGRVYEGFLEIYNVNEPYIDSDGKIAFHKYSDGGRWYRYHFSDYLEMNQVVAWCYKPIAPNPKT
jgi:hypothetical protein